MLMISGLGFFRRVTAYNILMSGAVRIVNTLILKSVVDYVSLGRTKLILKLIFWWVHT